MRFLRVGWNDWPWKILEARSYASQGMVAPRCNSYCCNPDNDAAGPWCFVMDQAD